MNRGPRHVRPSRTAPLLLVASCFALGSHRPAQAEGSEPSARPALAACQRFATHHYQQVRPQQFASLRLLEEHVSAEKYADRVGGQPVRTVLTGRGVWQDKGGEPANVRFVCLLENSEKPIFFEVLEDGRRDPVDVCMDAFQPGGWGPLTDCLQQALKGEEAAMTAALSKATQQAGQSLDPTSAKRTLHESNTQWAKYRDAECDRRQAAVAGRNHPDIGELTCRVRTTAQRVADMRFDE
jgi:uncharacterized protein YecT (DUF1311 family)